MRHPFYGLFIIVVVVAAAAAAGATSDNWIGECAAHPICRYAYQMDLELGKMATPSNTPEWAQEFVQKSEEAYRVRYANLTREAAIRLVAMLESRVFTPEQGLRCQHPRETPVFLDGQIVCVCAPRHDCTTTTTTMGISANGGEFTDEITIRDTATTLSIIFFVLSTLVGLAILAQLIVIAWRSTPTISPILVNTTTTS